MRLTAIRLQNYRAHQDLRVQFNAGFNVVAGINGSGKTSLLRGIADGLCWSLRAFYSVFDGLYPNDFFEVDWAHVRRERLEGRYRFEHQYPVRVSVEGVHDGYEFSYRVEKASDTALPEYKVLNPLDAQIHHGANSGSGAGLSLYPLMVFYRANRQWHGKDGHALQAATEKNARTDGYKAWWDAAVNVSDLQRWVISKCLERFQYSSETGKRFDDIDDDELALVNTALSAAVEGISGLRYDMHQKSLLVDWRKGGSAHAGEGSPVTISFDHLSDGQRAVICLVADIARRMCLLNPQLGMDVIKKTSGVVLIDELDVHLHPSWQRRIVNGLKAAFPEVQFIATSHSPQILGELRPEEIILLREGETSQPQVSYGLDSSQILEEIMGASARNLQVEEQLRKLFAEIEGNRLDEAKRLLAGLRGKAAEIPDLSRAEALIRRKELIGR